MIKVKDVVEHFLSRADWVDRARTVDRVVIGDPEKDVERCVVSWMPTFAAVREAVRRGVGLMICHEPVFYDHLDRLTRDPAAEYACKRHAAAKHEFIAKSGLAIVRIHDSWDRWPEVGIPWAWAQFLGLGCKPVAVGANGYQHRYDIEPVNASELARRVAQKCAALGEQRVQLAGDWGARVSRVGSGTGCACDINVYLEMGCDCSIVCDDGSCYWAGIQMARDLGHPVIRVNHGTSEEPGMVTLTRYVNENIAGLHADLVPHGSSSRLVG